MLRKVLTTSAALLVITPAHASEWWFITGRGAKGNATVVFMDRESIRDTSQTTKRVWLQQFWQKPVDGMASATTLSEYDCAERRYRAIQFTAHDTAGASLLTDRQADSWSFAAPETLANDLLSFACGATPQSKELKLEQQTPQELADEFFSKWR